MAFEKITFRFPLLFQLLKVFSFLLAAVSGSSSSDVQTSDLDLQPEGTNSTYYSLRGSTFVLNCTVMAGNLQASDLTWQHNGKQLLSDVRQIDSTTIQLTLSNTSISDSGVYWCGPKSGKMSQGVNMSLIVADPPSPPRNFRWSVVGVDLKREYRIFWSASSYTGGLPVNYAIKLCANDTFMSTKSNGVCKWSSNPECRPEHVLSSDKDFFCVLKSPQDFVSPCKKNCNYIISVVATNDVGSATSWKYMPYIPGASATPFPPTDFNVVATSEDKELRVSWTPRRFWKYVHTREYTILYHQKDKMENKTKVFTNKTFTLLTDLEVFVEYYVYLMVRFINEDGVRSAPSEVIGPRIAKTTAGEPDTPSRVLKDTSVTFPGNPALRNVTVEWKLSDNVSWRGTPGQYIVSCHHLFDSLGFLPGCNYHVDATSNMTVLARLNSAGRYSVYIKMCNKEKQCSSPSESYTIEELKDNITPQKNGGQLTSKQIAWITVSVVLGCLTFVFAMFVIRKWRRGELRDVLYSLVPLRERGVTIPDPVQSGYYYADPQPQHAYDELIPNEKQA